MLFAFVANKKENLKGQRAGSPKGSLTPAVSYQILLERPCTLLENSGPAHSYG